MCDYCGRRTMRVVDDLGAERDQIQARAGQVRRAIEASRRVEAEQALDALVDLLGAHTDVEEMSLFAGLDAAGEVGDEVASLAAEHASVWSTLDNLDDESWNATVLGVLHDLDDHIAREEYDLFPAAVVSLAQAAWDDVEARADAVRSGTGEPSTQ